MTPVAEPKAILPAIQAASCLPQPATTCSANGIPDSGPKIFGQLRRANCLECDRVFDVMSAAARPTFRHNSCTSAHPATKLCDCYAVHLRAAPRCSVLGNLAVYSA